MPAVQGHTAGSDKSPAPAERGWADRIECPACSYVTSVIWPAKKSKLTIDAMAQKLRAAATPSILVRSKK